MSVSIKQNQCRLVLTKIYTDIVAPGRDSIEIVHKLPCAVGIIAGDRIHDNELTLYLAKVARVLVVLTALYFKHSITFCYLLLHLSSDCLCCSVPWYRDIDGKKPCTVPFRRQSVRSILGILLQLKTIT